MEEQQKMQHFGLTVAIDSDGRMTITTDDGNQLYCGVHTMHAAIAVASQLQDWQDLATEEV
jgi:hypothetical protein